MLHVSLVDSAVTKSRRERSGNYGSSSANNKRSAVYKAGSTIELNRRNREEKEGGGRLDQSMKMMMKLKTRLRQKKIQREKSNFFPLNLALTKTFHSLLQQNTFLIKCTEEHWQMP